METKKINELPIAETLTENTNVLIESDGSTQRIPAKKIAPDGMVKSVNGNVPDATGNVTVEIPEGLPEGAAAHQQLVTDGDGVAKWEDRLTYEQITEYLMQPTNVVMDHETTLPNGEQAIAGTGPLIGAADLDNVCVVWNGVEYYFEEPIHISGSGSGATYGLATDGFMIVAGSAPFPIGILSASGNIGDVHNVAIYKRDNKQVKPLDPKYLPGEIPTIQSASVGQTIVVKAVDDTGKPTEWETSDIPEPFSGDYNDLTNKPTIPAAQVQADWNVTDQTNASYIKNKPEILTEAKVNELINTALAAIPNAEEASF